ncbi:sulfate transporter family-domain-containing protein [Mycena rebaudengoi]|nr:sulfate transporter family-domain-containing protein [Mycena rebaudengoi]
MSDVVFSRPSRFFAMLPMKLYRALPAVILGTLFNILDTVSTGLLIFPSDGGAFKYLQLQGLSMYILSTLSSQIVMTMGGSRFPGALGAMLIEILPFLRGIGSDIRGALGDSHPGLIPTVMAAYALTSFLTGAAFIVLGLLKLGTLVAYFPQTVLTGAIGAIGVSLFILGLALPYPPESPALSLSNAASMLFDRSHLTLLAASFLPAFILSVSLRSQTRGLVSNAYYVPVYLLSMPAIFWITVKAGKFSKDFLISTGWLFRVEVSYTSSAPIVANWNYWTLFDFRLNIVLLVVIGVLNLPIYVPSLAFTLDMAYDMNHELLGQGAANILAGVFGTVPNVLQYSYSVWVTRANGGRFEMWLVCLLTFVLFLTSGLLLPFVPTILASALVLFLGIELFLEAMWESSKTLSWMEYLVVVGTLASCTFLGFAEGFGVGIGAATVVYLLYGVIDSPARVTRWNEWNEFQQLKTPEEDPVLPILHGRFLSSRHHTPSAITLAAHYNDEDHVLPSLHGRLLSAHNHHTPSALTLATHNNDSNSGLKSPPGDDVLARLNARVITVSGYVFFASIPSLERQLVDAKEPISYFIVDLTDAHRIETSAARCIARCVRDLEIKSRALILCGVVKGSGLHADFARSEVSLVLDTDSEKEEKGVLAFGNRASALAWCQQQHDKDALLKVKLEGTDSEARDAAFIKFCELFDFDIRSALGDESPASRRLESLPEIERFIGSGGRIRTCLPGQMLSKPGDTAVIFIIEGEVELLRSLTTQRQLPTDTTITRPSVQRLLVKLPGEALWFVKTRVRSSLDLSRVRDRFRASPARMLKAGDVLDTQMQVNVAIAQTRTVLVEINTEAEKLLGWARLT